MQNQTGVILHAPFVLHAPDPSSLDQIQVFKLASQNQPHPPDDHYFVLGVKQDAEHIQHLQYQESETGWWLDKSAVKNFRKLATQV